MALYYAFTYYFIGKPECNDQILTKYIRLVNHKKGAHNKSYWKQRFM